MGMEVAHDVADDLGAFAMLGIVAQRLLPHGEQNSTLYRFHAVAHVWERARRDDAERVVQIARLCDFVKGRCLDPLFDLFE